MAEMRKERPAASLTVDLGNVNVAISQPTSGTKLKFRGDRNTQSLILPAGAYSVYIRNADFGTGEFSVNGEVIAPNGVYSDNAQFDHARNNQDFLDEIVIDNPAGKKFWLDVSYPSSSNFNPDSI